MSDIRKIAVIDIGKTNAKVVVFDAASGQEIACLRRANTILAGPPYPHFDVEGLWAFILQSLRRFGAEPGFDAVSITTHGACLALLDEAGELALPILDYEYAYPADVIADYDAVRPDFRATFSPRLPAGLNAGAQLHYQKRCFAADFEKVSAIVTYPQYWAFRLTGVLANEATSLGCHTDLWCPAEGDFSSLVEKLGIGGKLASVRPAFEPLGSLKAEVADAIAIGRTIPVYCGIHDSNASLLPHLVRGKPPFSVVSTGTWIISFAVGGNVDGLDPARDTLCNVDAYGRAVPSARYMGGREYELLTAGRTPPDNAAIAAAVGDVVARGVMLLPNVVEGCGPLPGGTLTWYGEPEDDAAYFAVVALYSALMTQTSLGLIGAQGKTIVEGPFAGNLLYLQALAALTGREVVVAEGGAPSGTAEGAALLCGIAPAPVQERSYHPGAIDLASYRALFFKRLSERG
ncbi:FGGY-family carbohydrate kinase [Allorhizobium undicola]|uniref:FGGY-family carbohydrate kinase n=1 Tax=Allorhizobium undicola TaxID=78527 RepID=UPI000485CE51|nr:FGGY-family carbohydrate kinase [Allorhizobium undicola]